MTEAAYACVIPCYNAGDRVAPVVRESCSIHPRVIVVDDGSTDGGLDPLDDESCARILRHEKNRGKGHAILTGLRAALEDDAVDAVALLDADGQHDPAMLPEFYKVLGEEDADLVIGARVFDGNHVPLRSRVGNAVTARVTRLLLGTDLPDTQCGYRMLSRRFAEDLLAHVAGGRYETEMEMLVRAIRGGYRVTSLPIQTIYEQGNRSSHFHKIEDSVRIYARLFRALLRRI